MRNLTLAIEDEVLQQARKLALDMDTTVNSLVREYLRQLVRGREEKLAAGQRLKDAMRRRPLEVGPRTWTRADLHER